MPEDHTRCDGDPLDREPRVVIVAEHASARFGGEAILPLHYFRFLRRRGIEAWLVVHERTREELEQALDARDLPRVYFVPDRWLQRRLWQLGSRLPHRIRMLLVEFPCHFLTQLSQRRIVRQLVRGHGADVVHEPIPVSPKVPSLMHSVGVPVVIGPMNGGMDFPPAFRREQALLERSLIGMGRLIAGGLNRLIPGKRKASLLLVANERTRRALPRGAASAVLTLVENGVDLSIWRPQPEKDGLTEDTATRVLFMGRLVSWKRVDLLLKACARVMRSGSAAIRIEILGDGSERRQLEELAAKLGLGGHVTFHGFKSQSECAAHLGRCDLLVLPSLYECGGAVVLEAMAMAKPVVATAWGGPADYLDATCGFLVEPKGEEELISGLADSITTLALDRDLRVDMGLCGRRKVEAEYDWEVKIDHILDCYRTVASAGK